MIYFVQGIDGGPVKIGYTGADDVARRVASMQTGSPVRLVVRATLDGDVGVERAWHARFAEDRLHGEWFRPSRGMEEAVGVALPRDHQRPEVILHVARGIPHGPLTAHYQAVVDGARNDWRWIGDVRHASPLLRQASLSSVTLYANALVRRGRLEQRTVCLVLGETRKEYRLAAVRLAAPRRRPS